MTKFPCACYAARRIGVRIDACDPTSMWTAPKWFGVRRRPGIRLEPGRRPGRSLYDLKRRPAGGRPSRGATYWPELRTISQTSAQISRTVSDCHMTTTSATRPATTRRVSEGQTRGGPSPFRSCSIRSSSSVEAADRVYCCRASEWRLANKAGGQHGCGGRLAGQRQPGYNSNDGRQDSARPQPRVAACLRGSPWRRGAESYQASCQSRSARC
jgi:hypothetical protein